MVALRREADAQGKSSDRNDCNSLESGFVLPALFVRGFELLDLAGGVNSLRAYSHSPMVAVIPCLTSQGFENVLGSSRPPLQAAVDGGIWGMEGYAAREG